EAVLHRPDGVRRPSAAHRAARELVERTGLLRRDGNLWQRAVGTGRRLPPPADTRRPRGGLVHERLSIAAVPAAAGLRAEPTRGRGHVAGGRAHWDHDEPERAADQLARHAGHAGAEEPEDDPPCRDDGLPFGCRRAASVHEGAVLACGTRWRTGRTP